MTDFIDRAKLEALAKEYADVGVPELDAEAQKVFMAGAAAYAALLDAETTEEWGVLVGGRVSEKFNYAPYTEERARSTADGLENYKAQAVSRRVTPWLPSEGGEKP